MKFRTAYENALNRAIGSVEAAMQHAREAPIKSAKPEQEYIEIPLESLSREDFIAYRKLREIKKSLEILRENSWEISFKRR